MNWKLTVAFSRLILYSPEAQLWQNILQYGRSYFKNCHLLFFRNEQPLDTTRTVRVKKPVHLSVQGYILLKGTANTIYNWRDKRMRRNHDRLHTVRID